LKLPISHFQKLAIPVNGLVFFLLLIGCSPKTVQVKTQHQQYAINSTYPDNPQIESFISPYRDSLETVVDKVLATSEVELTLSRVTSEVLPSQVALGNFMNDAALSIARQEATELNKPVPDISIFTWGSFRKSLPAGKITLRNVYELMPFENEIVILKLSGKQVGSLLNQLSENFNPIGGARMMKGDMSSITLDNGKPFREEEYYWVLASDYHAFGGDNLSILKEASQQYLCGIKMRDALVMYLEQLTQSNQTLKPNYDAPIKN